MNSNVDEYLHPFIINTMIQPQIIAPVKHVPSLTIHNFFSFFYLILFLEEISKMNTTI